MAFNARGRLAVAELALYVPVLLIVFYLNMFRHGQDRNSRWMLLIVFILFRLASAAVLIAAQETEPSQVMLYTVAYGFINVGISPLLLTAGLFLQRSGTAFLNEIPNSSYQFGLMNIFGSVASTLALIGSTDFSKTITLVSVFYLLAFVVLIAELHIVFWVIYRNRLGVKRRQFIGVSAAVPFLLIRVIYQVISAFAPNNFPPGPYVNNSVSKFNVVMGDFWIYMVLGMFPEFAAVIIYMVEGSRKIVEEEGEVKETTDRASIADSGGSMIHVPLERLI